MTRFLHPQEARHKLKSSKLNVRFHLSLLNIKTLAFLSGSAAALALILAVAGILMFERKMELLPQQHTRSADDPYVGSPQESIIGPLPFLTITPKRLHLLSNVLSALLAVVAISAGIRAKMLRGDSKMTAIGITFGGAILLWQAVVYLGVT